MPLAQAPFVLLAQATFVPPGSGLFVPHAKASFVPIAQVLLKPILVTLTLTLARATFVSRLRSNVFSFLRQLLLRPISAPFFPRLLPLCLHCLGLFFPLVHATFFPLLRPLSVPFSQALFAFLAQAPWSPLLRSL